MKKVRCISLTENLQRFWASNFKLGDEVCVFDEDWDFYEVSDPDEDDNYTWLVDKECFEEVCDE